MRRQLDARTEWEVEAARRRELIESDIGPLHLLRTSREPGPVEPTGSPIRQRRIVELARSVVVGRSDEPSDMPSMDPQSVRAMKPGT